MPIENERKYVLKSRVHLEEDLAKLCSSYQEISQGYLFASNGQSLRVRKTLLSTKVPIYEITYKQRVVATNGCTQSIEIENEILDEDWKALWPTTTQRLVKRRYILSDWEIDFFQDNNTTYFIMAEIELHQDQMTPVTIPNFITENLLYEVKNDDCRFSSRKLSDPKYAKKILNKLMFKELQ